MSDRPLAAFDFDGTLTRGDSLIPFLCRLSGRPKVAVTVFRHAVPLGLVAAGRGDRDATKALVIARLLAGVPLSVVEETAQAQAEATMKRLRPRSVERLRWHLGEGHEVVIVSASPDCTIAPVAERLGAHAVLGTRLEVDDEGRLTGRIDGFNNRADEKVRRLHAHFGETVVHRETWAYGDSSGDDAMLAFATHAFRVTGDKIRPHRPPELPPQ